MSVLAAFFSALIVPVALALHYYGIIIIAAVIVSLLQAFNVLNTSNRFVYAVCQTLHAMTDPYFKFFRKLLPARGNIDFSPMLGLLALYFLQGFIPRLLAVLAGAFA